MLVLRRTPKQGDQSIFINADNEVIEIAILSIDENTVNVGIKAPAKFQISRSKKLRHPARRYCD
ncbi:MAG: carbon storage regulator [Candidatus Sedimenticola sp. PURPLELP]